MPRQNHPERPRLNAIAAAHVNSGNGDARVQFIPDGEVHEASSGLRVVHVRPQYFGIDIFGAERLVRFDASGGVLGERGPEVRLPEDLSTLPEVNAAAAVLLAARAVTDHVRERQPDAEIKVSRYAPRVIARFPGPSRPTTLHKTPFLDPVTARLLIFPDGNTRRLAWQVHLILPDELGEYETVIAADAPEPEVLTLRRTVAYAVEGHVFAFNPDEDARAPQPFPRPAVDYPGTHPTGFPTQWVDGDATSGNNAVSWPGNRKRPYKGARSGSNVVFTPSPTQHTEQRQLNAFYFCNFLHDFFYLLGFDEAEGNFQKQNLTGAGKDDDHVEIRVFDSEITGMATMRSRRDGKNPELKLGLKGTRHTALDADVVIHEFTHGVTNRMIGGADNHDPLQQAGQPRALGEGFSDYFAVTIQNYLRRRDNRPEKMTFGAWIANDDAKGFRPHAYDANYPGHYGTLGQPGFDDPHDAGQVWGLALIRMNAAIGDRLGTDAGARNDGDAMGWQLIVDSLKLLQADTPRFVDARDAVLDAFDAKAGAGQIPGDSAAMRTAIAGAFTSMGMGPAAQSPSGAYAGIQPDFGT